MSVGARSVCGAKAVFWLLVFAAVMSCKYGCLHVGANTVVLRPTREAPRDAGFRRLKHIVHERGIAD